ncbi:MAG: PKD domain-containing protein [Bacteroidetes bacterium]|nr:PKD domain-containing protein [Bacteroidota bacterium]
MLNKYYFVLLLILLGSNAYAQPLNANFTYSYTNNSQCAPAIIVFTNTTVGGVQPYTYEWTFQDGNPSTSTLQNPTATFLSCGTKTITLTVTGANGLTNTETVNVNVACEPNPQFVGGPSLSGCPPLSVNFTNQSNTGGPPGPLTYTWDFCDGVTTTLTNPSHTYSLPGSYCVKLNVTNQFGCSYDTTYNNYVNVTSPPVADIEATTPASGCAAPLNVSFSGLGSTPSGAVTYQWSFPTGVPNSSTSPTPTVQFGAGSHTVILTVTDGNGCSNTLTLPNYVNVANNQADIQVSSTTVCIDNTVDFGAGSAVAYTWTINPNVGFANNTGNLNSSGLNLEFTAAGNYNVCLTMEFNGGCVANACTTIVVNPIPSANFGVLGNQIVCQPPQTITISPLPAPGNTYSWAFPGANSQFSSSLNPGPVTYSSCGNFPISLTVTNAFGCQVTKTLDTIVNINCPQASFNALFTPAQLAGQLCVPATIPFDATMSTGNPTQYIWNWNYDQNPNGWQPPSNNPQPNYTFNQPGCYTIGLIINNAQNCRDTLIIPNLVCAGTLPQANFVANDTTPCINEPVAFTNLSTPLVVPPNPVPPGVTYLWKFGDGSTSTAFEPTKAYTDTGFKDITLITCWYGCCDTLIIEKYIYVAPPKAVITVNRPCNEPYCVQFSGKNSLGPDVYQWTFSGAANPATSNLDSVKVCWPPVNGGPFTAKLKVINSQYGCEDSTTVSFTLVKPVAGFTMTPTTGCKPLKCTIQHTGSGLFTAQYFIYAGPTCTGVPIATVNANSAFPGGNPNFYTFNNVGVYSVRQIVTNLIGCKDTINRNAYITVYGLTPKFTQNDSLGCAPKTIQFTNQTQPNSMSTPTGYQWVFGDPASGAQNTSNLANPTHTYNNQGNYDVWLIAYDDNGCSDTLKKPQLVKLNKPVADFISPTTILCVNQLACFSSLSTGTNLSYYWDFGDPPSGPLNNSSLFNPCHTYNQTGTFTVFLRVVDQFGCKDSITKPAYINVGDLQASIELSDTFISCPPLLVNFTNTSVGVDPSSVFSWNFGDGVQSVLENPSHLYTEAGYFDISFSITNQFGCGQTYQCDSCIFIGGATATVSADNTFGCVPHQVCFTATNSNSISYVWNTGVIVQADDDTYCYTYTDEGIYRAEVFLTDTAGCTYPYFVDSIYITDNVAKFGLTPNELCGQGPVSFTDSSEALSPIIAWQWDFGDPNSGQNNFSNAQNPTHTYSAPGTYYITMTSTATGGCNDTYLDSVMVTDAPVADFTNALLSLCESVPVQFTNTSVSASAIVGYSWNFSDPGSGAQNTSTVANPTHTFSTAGDYDVRLIVTASNGCTDTIIYPITINQTPQIFLNPSQSICIGDSTTLQFAGAGTYLWAPALSLDDASLPNPLAFPIINTTYTLTYTDANGCSGNATTIVNVNPLPNANAGPDQNTFSGNAVTLNGSGGAQYFWLPSGEFVNPGLQNPSVSPTVTSTYTVIVTGANGCTSSDEVVVIVTPCPTSDAGNDTAICLGTNAILTGIAGTSDYQWTSIPAGTNSNNISINVSPVVNTTYILAVTDNTNGCIRYDSVVVTIILPFVADAGTDATICLGGDTTLQAGGSVQYSWSPTTNLSDPNISNPVASPLQTTTYTVTVSDGVCNTLTDEVVVIVNPLPNASAGIDTAICLNDNAQLQASGGIQYQWSPLTDITNPNTATPTVNPTVQTTYTVSVTDANGCVNTDDLVISILPLPIADAGLDVAICINDSVQLQGSGGIQFAWAPAGNIDLIDSPTPVVFPTITTTYTLTVTDANTCSNTDEVIVTINPLPNADAGPDQTICSQTAAYLSASGGIQYSWTPIADIGNPNQQGTIAYPQTPQFFYVMVTDVNGCEKTDSLFINILYPFDVEFPTDTCVCLGSTMVLSINDTSSVPHYYNWSPPIGVAGATDSSSISASPFSDVTYTAIVSDGQCYADTGVINLCVNPIPEVEAGPNQQMLLGESVQLGAVGTGQFSWSPDSTLSCANCAEPLATPLQTLQYTVTLTDNNGCSNKDSLMVFVICSDQVIYIPNAFTPDGDEVNPVFKTYGTGIQELIFLRIYNRWGELVFETADLSKGWDGTHRGKLQEPGVYVYYLEAICTTGQTISKQGNVSLIR